MRLVVTGGHLSPLLSVLESLPKDTNILVIGRKHALEGDRSFSLEYQVLKSMNVSFESITTGRLQRKITRRTWTSLFKFPYGFLQSLAILKKYKPDAVLTFGGYVSLPVILASFFLRIPVVIHEQTLEAGLTNKIGSIFAKKVCISWESSAKSFPVKKTVLTGNPLRKEFLKNDISENNNFKNDRKTIYFTGGSLGSHKINELIEGCVEKLLLKFEIIHQTGDAKEYGDFDRLEKLRNSFESKLKERYTLMKFVDPKDVVSVFKSSDLIVCRSGINTVSELIFFKKPCLLIPLPYSSDDEQKKNALFVKELGLGEVADQSDLTSEKLYGIIITMIENIDEYKKNGKDINGIIKQDAALRIVNVLKTVIKK